ncbi:MAG TPA: SH3 domain-containing protein, partial [Cyclobacteriaceae bacterium]|nr:SH3 domain-containing protein [Cyclobacteriaceae bacterium]
FVLHASQQTLWVKAIIAKNNTYVMNGPSAGASVLTIVRDGHRVDVLSTHDIWTKIKIGDSEGYVRSSSLLPVKL